MGTYSRGTYPTYGDLPADDTDLTTTMSAGEVSDVATINNVFVGQNLSNQVAAMQFKNTCSASLANLLWVGQSDMAPSISPITLEAYNYSTAAWVGQATNAAAATNATCTLGVTLGTTQYISPGGYTTGRVYQAATAGGESLLFSYEVQTAYFFINQTDQFQGGGQPFQGDGSTITKLGLYLRNAGLSGDTYLRLYATTGTFGTDMVPTGSPLATSAAFNANTITGSDPGEWVEKAMTTPYATVNGTWYAAVVEYEGTDNGNLLRCWYGTDTIAEKYNGLTKKATTWTANVSTLNVDYRAYGT